MTEKEKFQLILNLLNKLDIHGQDNILIMYNLINFIMKEIQVQSEKESSPLINNGG